MALRISSSDKDGPSDASEFDAALVFSISERSALNWVRFIEFAIRKPPIEPKMSVAAESKIACLFIAEILSKRRFEKKKRRPFYWRRMIDKFPVNLFFVFLIRNI